MHTSRTYLEHCVVGFKREYLRKIRTELEETPDARLTLASHSASTQPADKNKNLDQNLLGETPKN